MCRHSCAFVRALEVVFRLAHHIDNSDLGYNRTQDDERTEQSV